MSSDRKSVLELPSRWMNQAGSLGFSPMLSDPLTGSIFVTNPISYRSRKPSNDRDVIPFPGGFLLHTGLSNPGWKAVRKKYAAHWLQYRLPVWVHLISQDLAELTNMVRDCEEMESVAAIELGLPPGCPPDAMKQMVQAACGEKPLVLHINAADDLNLLRYIPPEVSAVSLAAPRGRLQSAQGTIISGRLHGPGLFPLMLQNLYSLGNSDFPIIMSGICNKKDGEIALQCGAAAVQMDHMGWMGELPDGASI
jgi:dihydroorotate dehydrogenase